MLSLIVNGLINLVYVIVYAIMALLPETPFDFRSLSWGNFGIMIGYVFPVNAMFIHMSVIITAFLLYYVVRWLLRMIRQIQ
jgi:hypothetical protein